MSDRPVASRVSNIRPKIISLLAVFFSISGFVPGAEKALSALFGERVKSIVAVEFYLESEGERRQQSVVFGTVADASGVVVLPASAINGRTPPSQIKDMKVFRPGESASFSAVYLGPDAITGWHFIRVEEKMRPLLVPITKFAKPGATPPVMGQFLWGIALRDKSEDFLPYYLESKLSMVVRLPETTGFALTEVAAPGLPVFSQDGVFVGLARESFGQNYIMFSQREHGTPVTLVDLLSSSIFQFAGEVLPDLARVPKQVTGRPSAWLGAYGLQPVEPEVADFLNLKDQSGVVVSETLESSPAAVAGVKDRDIILAIDGKSLPRLKPDRVVVEYFDREVEKHVPGDSMTLTILRGKEKLQLTAKLVEQPKMVREAQRQYFESLGFSVREFVFGDGVAKRIKLAESGGVVSNFVKPNSPASAAGLRPEDWIREIDGKEIKTYEDGIAALKDVASDTSRSEFVLLVGRNGDTSVLRIKLK